MALGRQPSCSDEWSAFKGQSGNLGDVIVEPEDMYGEGINIAPRLEGIARPGDLFISGGVYEQIKNKLVCAYQSFGDRQVKNITDPVSVYRMLPDPSVGGAAWILGFIRSLRRRDRAGRRNNRQFYFPAILSNTDCTVCASALWLMSTFLSGDDPALLTMAISLETRMSPATGLIV
jgi:hypothetical protein